MPYERVEYLPFGEVWIEDVDPATSYIPFRFTSKELDRETGLYYYGARYYEPKVSRWMSADPAGFVLVNPMEPDEEGGWKAKGSYSVIEAANWYSYVSNNPVRYVDPTGEEAALAIAGGTLAGFPEPFTTLVGLVLIASVIAIAVDVASSEDGVKKPKPTIEKPENEDEPKPTEAGDGDKLSDRNDRPNFIDDDTDLSDPSTWPLPEGVKEEDLTEGELSRKKARERGEKSWYDDQGGEYRPHKPDCHHPEGHFDYKPPGENSKWEKCRSRLNHDRNRLSTRRCIWRAGSKSGLERLSR